MNSLDDSTIRVVFGADENYALPAAVSIRSLLDHYRGHRKLEIYVVDGGVSAESKRSLVESCDGIPQWVDPKQRTTDRINEQLFISEAMYLRLQIPSLFPDFQKVLYLDSDILVLDDVSKLWEQPLSAERPIAAVLSWLTPSGHRALEARGFGERSHNFNSGVLLMDVPGVRSSIDRAIEIVRAGGLFLPDQDALNLAFDGRWVPLAPRWNAQFHAQFRMLGHRSAPWRLGGYFTHEEVDDMLNRPAIVHFASPLKPWHLDAKGLDYTDAWLACAASTAWGNRVHDYCVAETTRRTIWSMKKSLEVIMPSVSEADVAAFVERLPARRER